MIGHTFELCLHAHPARPPWLPDPNTTHPAVAAAWRDKLIREAAYFRSQKRPAREGGELEDWVAAEKEIDALLSPEQ